MKTNVISTTEYAVGDHYHRVLNCGYEMCQPTREYFEQYVDLLCKVRDRAAAQRVLRKAIEFAERCPQSERATHQLHQLWNMLGEDADCPDRIPASKDPFAKADAKKEEARACFEKSAQLIRKCAFCQGRRPR